MILILDSKGRRLCNDRRWRDYALFGDYPECVKTYRYAGHAGRTARRVKGTAYEVPDGVVVEAGGSAYQLVPSGSGERTVPFDLRTSPVV